MQISRTILTGLLGMALGSLPGCFLKKKNKVAAAPAPPPPITQPQPEVILPPPAGEPNRSEPAPPPQPAENTTAEASTQPPPKPKSHPRTPRKIVPPPPPKPEENKSAQNPPSGPLTATVTPNEALRQKMTTQQLLDATEANLKSISRTLSADEQTMVSHIRSYMQQSTKATSDGDYEKAYNLAVKAHLLSADLIKH